MKVIIACDYYPPSRGGIQTHCYELTEELRKKKMEAIVFTKKEKRNKGHIKEIPFLNIKYLRGFSFMVLLTFFIAKSMLSKNKPDIIHSHSYQPTIAAIIAKKITRSKTPIIMTSHGIVAESTVTGRPFWYRKTFGFITKSMEIYSIRHADFVISVDKLFEEYALKYIPKDKITVISNWVNTDLFNKNNKNKEIEALKGKDLIVSCPRRLDKKNGLEYSIKAFGILNKKVPKTKLWLVGGGDYETKLRELVEELNLQENVIFFGYQKREDMPYYMNASDIILLTCPIGNFSFTLLEALACGKTVVATNVGDTLDFEGIDSNVMVLCEHEVNRIAKTLEDTINGKYKLNKIQTQAVKIIKEKYSKDIVVKNIIKVYGNYQK